MTGPASLVSVSVRMAAAAAALLAIGFVLACEDGDEEIVTITGSATPTSVAPATATPASSPTAEPTPVPTVPPDWVSLKSPDSLFTLRYPPDWFRGVANDVYSKDPATFSGPGLPPEVIKVEAGHTPAVGSEVCGPGISVDPGTGESLGPLPGAMPADLGGVPGWETVRGEGDPAIEGNLTRIQGISVIHAGYCFQLAAYYTQKEPDVEVFQRIASAFEFNLPTR